MQEHRTDFISFLPQTLPVAQQRRALENLGLLGPVVNVDWYAEVADTDDSAMVGRAITAAGENGTIVGAAGKVYTLRRLIKPTAKNLTILNMHFKRADAETATTTATINANDTVVTVDDTTGFLVGDRVAILHTASADGGKHNNDIHGSLLLLIENVTATQITVSNPIPIAPSAGANFPIGSTVVRVNNLFTFSDATLGRVRFIGCTFDGNRAGNDHTYSWVVNSTASFSSAAVDHVTAEGCTFLNTPCENFVGPCNATITNCQISSLYGSVYHGSEASFQEDQHILLENITGNGVCLAGLLNGHNEGLLTYSVNVINGIVRNSTVTNGGNGIIGSVSDNDDGLFIEGGRYEDFARITSVNKSSGLSTRGVVIRDATFVNCGDISISGSKVEAGAAVQGVRIRNCLFDGNTRLLIKDAADIELENLVFRYEDEYDYGGPLGALSAAIDMTFFDRLRMHNITMEAPPTFDSDIATAIMLRCDNMIARKTSGGVDTNILYATGVNISKLRLSGWRNGFSGAFDSNRVFTRRVLGWEIDDVVVHGYPNTTHTPDGTVAADIRIPPGAVATNLHSYPKVFTNTNYYPIQIYGIDDTADETLIRGATVVGAYIWGPSTRGFRIGGTTSGRSNWNIYAEQLYVNGNTSPVLGNDALRNLIATPVDLDATSLPGLTAEEHFVFPGLYENSGQY